MSAGQGGPGPAEIGEERFEKNAEGHMGADPCRLDGKASGCNDVAVKQDGLFHKKSITFFSSQEGFLLSAHE